MNLDFLPALNRPGIWLDIGCNAGEVLGQMVLHATDQNHIIGYEPNRRIIHNLTSQIYERYGWVWPKNIEIHQVALSNTYGRIKLRTPQVGDQMRWGLSSIVDQFDLHKAKMELGDQAAIDEEYVQVTTLDAQGLDDVSFIKIDVEGAEEEVVLGGTNLIRACRPVMVLELVNIQRPGCTQRAQQLMASLGYDGYFIYQDTQFFSMDAFRVALHQRCKDDGFGAAGHIEPFIYNLGLA